MIDFLFWPFSGFSLFYLLVELWRYWTAEAIDGTIARRRAIFVSRRPHKLAIFTKFGFVKNFADRTAGRNISWKVLHYLVMSIYWQTWKYGLYWSEVGCAFGLVKFFFVFTYFFGFIKKTFIAKISLRDFVNISNFPE